MFLKIIFIVTKFYIYTVLAFQIYLCVEIFQNILPKYNAHRYEYL